MLTYPYDARLSARAIYPHVRRQYPFLEASRALQYARHEVAINRVSDEIDWTGELSGRRIPDASRHDRRRRDPHMVG